jgi:hypothetical protein
MDSRDSKNIKNVEDKQAKHREYMRNYYKKRVLNNPSIRAELNERSKLSYHKNKVIKENPKPRGRKKVVKEKQPPKPRGRKIAITQSS